MRAPDLTGDALVAAQFAALAGLAWPGRPRWPLPQTAVTAAAATAVLGAGLAAAGGRALGPDLTPRATPPPGAALATAGPYRFTRNPIYLGLLTTTAGLAVLRRRPEPLLAWAALAGVLHVKVRVEERRLLDRYGSTYAGYAARAPRLLGWPGRGSLPGHRSRRGRRGSAAARARAGRGPAQPGEQLAAPGDPELGHRVG